MASTSLVGRSILIVEDEPLIALEIVTAFQNAGAVALTARSLTEAIHLVEHDGLSAAVLDFGLADGDADAVCARLDERHITFILHSGYTRHGLIYDRGTVIPKPACPETLIKTVVGLLRR